MIERHERRIATVAIGLIVGAALVPPIGTGLLTIATGDLRFALSFSLMLGFLLRWARGLLARRGLRNATRDASSDAEKVSE